MTESTAGHDRLFVADNDEKLDEKSLDLAQSRVTVHSWMLGRSIDVPAEHAAQWDDAVWRDAP